MRLFGSVVRGEGRSDSDIDLLVDADETTSPWFPVGLIDELESALGNLKATSESLAAVSRRIDSLAARHEADIDDFMRIAENVHLDGVVEKIAPGLVQVRGEVAFRVAKEVKESI